MDQTLQAGCNTSLEPNDKMGIEPQAQELQFVDSDLHFTNF